VQAESDLPTLELDAARMREVLSNLLTNALRYAPPGSQVLVRLAARPGAPPGVILEVQDSGPGIPAEDLPYIFDRFYKARDSGGMGLGLAIARHLVEAQGGRIQAESSPGQDLPAQQGTVMRVVF
jgi:signal transduction histidine kinase